MLICILIFAILFRMIEKQEPNTQLEDVRKIRNETANELLSIVLMFNTLEKVRRTNALLLCHPCHRYVHT